MLKHIRFDDNETRIQRWQLNKMAVMHYLFQDFKNNLQSHYSLSAYASIDDKWRAVRGKCAFSLYMLQKPNRYSIQIHALSNAKMVYTTKIEVYVDKQPFSVDNSNIALVSRLSQPILGHRKYITMDTHH